MKRFLIIPVTFCVSILLWSPAASAAWSSYSALPFGGNSARCVGSSGQSYCFGTWEANMTSKYNSQVKPNYTASYLTFNRNPECDHYSICTSVSVKVWVDDGEEITPVDCSSDNRICDGPIPPPFTCDAPNFIDPETGDCLAPQEPEECIEVGEFYNPRTQQCVTECPNGRLDNQCLAEPETECDESSGDYQGTVGWGENHRPVCAGDNQCQDNETYAFRENAEGSWSGRCISNETNPPVCPKGFEGALIITDGGFACEGLNPDPDNPNDPNDTSDGDSDGDGEGDTTGITGQLQDI